MNKYIAYVLFEKKISSNKYKDHYEEITLIVDANDKDDASNKINGFIKTYSEAKYVGDEKNEVTTSFANHVTINEFLGFDKIDGIEEINSKSFYDLTGYLKFRNEKMMD